MTAPATLARCIGRLRKEILEPYLVSLWRDDGYLPYQISSVAEHIALCTGLPTSSLRDWLKLANRKTLLCRLTPARGSRKHFLALVKVHREQRELAARGVFRKWEASE